MTVPLSIGPNVISFRLNAGQVDYTKSFTIFRVDSLEPPRITSIADGDFTNQTSLEISGLVPIGTPLVEVNGIPATIAADGVTFSATVPVHAGINRVAAQSLPSGGVDHVSFRQDLFPPSIFSVTPRDLTTTLATEAAFAGKASEPVEILITGPGGSTLVDSSEVTLSPDPFGFVDTEDRFSAEALPLIAGPNTFQFSVTDRAGNVTVESFQIENLPPALELVSPTDGGTTSDLRVSAVIDVLENVVLDAVYSGGGRIPAFEGLALFVGQNTLPPIPLGPGNNNIRLVYHRLGGGLSETLNFGLTSTADPLTTTTVEGQLIDAATGEVLSNSFVAITVGGITQVVVTDENGRYSVQVEPGSVAIVATSETYLSGSFGGTGNPGDTIVADFGLESNGLPSIMNEVAIVVPPDGTVTDFEALTVVGTVLNPASSVSVNGIQAEVVGNRFTARGIPLAMGANTINAVVTVPGLPTVNLSVSVERALEPVLAVTLFSPPTGSSVPGSGLVVRGFVSSSDAHTLAAGRFVSVEEGVFEVFDVDVPQGISVIRAHAQSRDKEDFQSAEVVIEADQSEPAIQLGLDPASGVAPLQTAATLSVAAQPFPTSRIDFDLDGDGRPELIDVASTTQEFTIGEEGRRVARAFVTTPSGVELSAPALGMVHLPNQLLREFAQGNPVDLANAVTGSDIFVLDGAAATISRYTADGVLVSSFGSSGAGFGQLSNPQALDVAPDGRIFVADTGNDRIQVFDEAGNPLMEFGGSGAGEGQLASPVGIAVTFDRILVAEEGNGRLQQFGLDGTPRGTIPFALGRGLSSQSDNILVSALDGPPRAFLDKGELVDLSLQQRLPTQARLGASTDVASSTDAIAIVDVSKGQVVLLSEDFEYRRVVTEFGGSPRAVLLGERPELETVYVANGMDVSEVSVPVPSPMPVLVSLRTALAQSDIEAAVALFTPTQRAVFREIFELIVLDLPDEAAAMNDVVLASLRANRAEILLRRTEDENGVPVQQSYLMILVRNGAGQWQIVDY